MEPSLEEKPDERLQFEQLSSRLSSRLINVDVGDMDGVIEEGLGLLGRHFDADRALVAEYVPHVKGWKRSHIWRSDRADPTREIAVDDVIYPYSYPRLTEHLQEEGCMVFGKGDAFPKDWIEEKEALSKTGVRSFVIVRLSVGNAFLGVISLDSYKDRDWPKDIVERVRFIGENFANALNRKRDRLALDDRLEFESMLSKIMAELMNFPVNEIDKIIEDGLALLGRFFRADRVAVSQYLEQEDRFWPSHLWLSEEFDPKQDISAYGHPIRLPRIFAHVRREGCFVYNRFEEIPEEWEEERAFMREAGAKAGVAVALRLRGEFLGVINIASLRSERVWPEGIVERLRFVGEMFARALMYKRSEESLDKAFTEIQRLKDQLEAENVLLKEEIKTIHKHEEITGSSRAIQEVLARVEQVAGTDSTVLVLGETGTGKEIVAQAIHNMSGRKDKPMVKVNCAAMPTTLVESELFGREKGAFTGALTRQVGRFEVARGGTIFLDEIGELSLDVQAKLLRVLQEGQFERLGSPETMTVDVRIIAATNRDLAAAVQDRSFREDLYYRLNVFPISVPPLRERVDDIPAMVWSFIKEFDKRMGKKIESVTRKDMEALKKYPWPGNIRELRNVIERAMILSNGTVLQIEMPKKALTPGGQRMTLEEMERKHILEILEMTGWRVRGDGGAAGILGLKPTTLEARMRKLGIERGK